jgi:hypothetical protein
MVTCKICSKELENNKGLSYHASQVHGQKFCDYLVEFEHGGIWPLCRCGCGEKVNFFGGKFTKNVGNHGIVGLKRTAETRKKISEIQRGRKLTEDHKNKIAQSVQARYDSDDSSMRSKISVTHKGKPLSEEHRKKLSDERKKKLSSGEIIINRDKISAAITQRYLGGGFEWSTGQYTSTKTAITCNYRSSWERELMELLDNDPTIATWKYEPMSLAYVHENQTRRYIPDFQVVTSDHDYLVEVKPPTLKDTQVNEAKRRSAIEFCERNGWRYVTWSSGDGLSSFYAVNQ